MMRKNRQNRGFILILVVALIPLYGLAVVLTTAQTAQLSRNLQTAQRQAEHKNLWLSVETWLDVNRDAALNLEAGDVIAVPVADIAVWPAACTAEMTTDECQDGRAVLSVTVTIESPRKTTVLHRKMTR